MFIACLHDAPCLLLLLVQPLVSLPAHVGMCTPGGWMISLRITVGGRPLASLGGRVRGQRLEATEIHVRVCPTPSNMDWSYLAVALDTTRPLTQASEQTVHYSHLRARASCPGTYLIQSKAARLVTMQDGLLVLCPVQVQ